MQASPAINSASNGVPKAPAAFEILKEKSSEGKDLLPLIFVLFFIWLSSVLLLLLLLLLLLAVFDESVEVEDDNEYEDDDEDEDEDMGMIRRPVDAAVQSDPE